MDKIFKTQFINLETNEIFTLPTPYTDRVEACVCGQNYCRDRQQEDGTALFFRVIIEGEKFEPYQQVRPILIEEPNEEDSEEPDYRELMESILEVCEEFGVNLVIPRT